MKLVYTGENYPEYPYAIKCGRCGINWFDFSPKCSFCNLDFPKNLLRKRNFLTRMWKLLNSPPPY